MADQISLPQLRAEAEQSRALAEQLGQVAAGLRRYGSAATGAVAAVDGGTVTLVKEWASNLTDAMSTRVAGDFRQTTDMATDAGIAASALEDTQQKLIEFSDWVSSLDVQLIATGVSPVVVGGAAPSAQEVQTRLDALAAAVVSNATTLNGTFQRPWLGSKGRTAPPAAPQLTATSGLGHPKPPAGVPGPAGIAPHVPVGAPALPAPIGAAPAAADHAPAAADRALAGTAEGGATGGGPVSLSGAGPAGVPAAALPASGTPRTSATDQAASPFPFLTLPGGVSAAKTALPGGAVPGVITAPSGLRRAAMAGEPELPSAGGGPAAATKVPRIALPGRLGGGAVGGSGGAADLAAESGAMATRTPGAGAARLAATAAEGAVPGGTTAGAAEGAIARGAAGASAAEAGAASRGGMPYLPPMGGMGGMGAAAARGGAAAIRPGVAERAGGPDLGAAAPATADVGVPARLRGRADRSSRSGPDRAARRARPRPVVREITDADDVLDEQLWRIAPPSISQAGAP